MNFESLKNLFFKCRHCFQGAPISLGGENFRVDESLRRWNATGESWVFQKMKEILNSGDGFLDIGANFGFHSLYAERLIGENGKIIAIEPIPRNLQILKRNLRLNGIVGNIRIEEVAISDSSAQYVTMEATASRADVTAAINVRASPSSLRVANMALDSFPWARDFTPQLLKIDIEGAEYSALKSGIEFLKRARPILLVEIHTNLLPRFDANAQEFVGFLSGLGYELQDKAEVDFSEDGCWHGIFSCS
jgi:FkbM family methyltransferase